MGWRKSLLSMVRNFWRNSPLNGLERGQKSHPRLSSIREMHTAIPTSSCEFEKRRDTSYERSGVLLCLDLEEDRFKRCPYFCSSKYDLRPAELYNLGDSLKCRFLGFPSELYQIGIFILTRFPR